MSKNALKTATTKDNGFRIEKARKSFGFKEVEAGTGVKLYVSERKADYPKSKSMLLKSGLEFLTYQEALAILTNDDKIKESLKDKWFWLAGTGINKELELYTVTNNGELVERPKNTSPEVTVRVWNGTNPLSFVVDSDNDASYCGGRFLLAASDEPGGVAPVVVGRARQSKDAASALLRKIKDEVIAVQVKIVELERLLRPEHELP